MDANDPSELLTASIEATSDGIYIHGMTGETIIYNTRFADIFNISRAIIPSKSSQEILDLIADQIEDSIAFLNWVNNFKSNPIADIITIKFLDDRILECYSAPLSKDGRLDGRVWTFEDITKLKRTEETAKLYLDLMSHDIRNRLQGIVMSAEILNLMVEDSESVSTIIDIENNVTSCATLISKVLDAEQIDDAPAFQRSIDDALITSIENIKARFSGVNVTCEFEDHEDIIKADRFLETLFINLIENAVQHNPRDDKQVWINIQRESTGFEISISDNGNGINSQRKIELFDKARRYGGVGLHVATQIARKYGGILRVFDRVPGDYTKGADFRLWIPEPIVRWG